MATTATSTRRGVTPARTGRRTLVLVALCGVLLVLGAALSWHGSSEPALDRSMARLLRLPNWRHRHSDHFLSPFQQLGSPAGAVIETAGLALAAAITSSRGRRYLVVAGPVMAAVAAELLKQVVRQRFPLNSGSYRFPSGHSATWAAFAVTAYALVPRRVKNWSLLGARLLDLLGLVLTALLGWGLLASHKHTFTEIIGGLCVGVLVARALLGATENREGGHSWVLGSRR